MGQFKPKEAVISLVSRPDRSFGDKVSLTRELKTPERPISVVTGQLLNHSF